MRRMVKYLRGGEKNERFHCHVFRQYQHNKYGFEMLENISSKHFIIKLLIKLIVKE